MRSKQGTEAKSTNKDTHSATFNVGVVGADSDASNIPLHTGPEDALYSTFVPRKPEDAAGSGAPLNASGQPSTRPPGPPVVYEPQGRRFKLGPYSLDSWMGWSLSLGHKPTTGISFWDIKFKGERLIYELSMQVGGVTQGGWTAFAALNLDAQHVQPAAWARLPLLLCAAQHAGLLRAILASTPANYHACCLCYAVAAAGGLCWLWWS